MPNKEDKMYSSAINPTNTTTTTSPQTNPDFLDKDANEYYSMLKNQSYKALLDKQVQAANAKNNALKYTNNMMQRSGYGSQGVSESTGLGIANSYRNALTGYQNEYNDALIKGAQEAQTIAMGNRDENYGSLYYALTATDDAGNSTYDYAGMQEILNRYGITRNADGSYNFDRANLSDAQKRNIVNMIAPLTKQYDTDQSNARLSKERVEELKQYAKELGYTDEQIDNIISSNYAQELYNDSNYNNAKVVLKQYKDNLDERNRESATKEDAISRLKEMGYSEKDAKELAKYADENTDWNYVQDMINQTDRERLGGKGTTKGIIINALQGKTVRDTPITIPELFGGIYNFIADKNYRNELLNDTKNSGTIVGEFLKSVDAVNNSSEKVSNSIQENREQKKEVTNDLINELKVAGYSEEDAKKLAERIKFGRTLSEYDTPEKRAKLIQQQLNLSKSYEEALKANDELVGAVKQSNKQLEDDTNELIQLYMSQGYSEEDAKKMVSKMVPKDIRKALGKQN